MPIFVGSDCNPSKLINDGGFNSRTGQDCGGTLMMKEGVVLANTEEGEIEKVKH